MPKFWIYYGLGSLTHSEIVEANSPDEAEEIARDACEELADSEMTWTVEPAEEEDED